MCIRGSCAQHPRGVPADVLGGRTLALASHDKRTFGGQPQNQSELVPKPLGELAPYQATEDSTDQPLALWCRQA